MKKIILIALIAGLGYAAAPGTYFVKQIIDARTGDSYYITQSSDVILGKQIDLSNGDSYYVGTSTGAWPVSVYNSERLGGEVATNYILITGTGAFATKLELDAETTARITADNAIAVDTATLRTDLTTLESDTATRFDAVAVDTVTIASDLASLAVSVAIDTSTLRSDLDAEIIATDADFASVAVDTTTLRTDLNTEIGDRVAGDNALGVSTGAIAGDLTAHTGDGTIHFTTGDIEKTTFTVLRAYEIKTSTITGFSPVYIPEMRSDSLKFGDDTELTTTAGLVSTTTAAATYLPKAGGTMTGDLVLENAEVKVWDGEFGAKMYIDGFGAGAIRALVGNLHFYDADAGESEISLEIGPDNIRPFGNISMYAGKTVDGRDISADGIKLDAVSISTANIASNLADNYYTAVETDDKIRIATETITAVHIYNSAGTKQTSEVIYRGSQYCAVGISTTTVSLTGATAINSVSLEPLGNFAGSIYLYEIGASSFKIVNAALGEGTTVYWQAVASR